ncbi:hypothetical protein BDK51DRAFT_38488 [Blyttiomyces helicus]|uniref:SH3 domain-containing protein n=1 Tax=Blyttiomyces helicus TaxID=388810 RepID=A0A4P9W785_9FUNG|nr:hypothetical protein BDK51DRAFT_38488 [Blyttiomyces helicus]|eukprot:RKO87235.1 hypothetical protein BDK51DRAFT_38488 [Blyttiomyces helicus]
MRVSSPLHRARRGPPPGAILLPFASWNSTSSVSFLLDKTTIAATRPFGLDSRSAPVPGSFGHSCSPDDQGQFVYCYGGFRPETGSPFGHSDLTIYDTVSNTSTVVPVSLKDPTIGRGLHSSAFVDLSLYIFGGVSSLLDSSPANLYGGNNILRYDLLTNNLTRVNLPSGSVPSQIVGSCAVKLRKNQILLIGGTGAASPLWLYNAAANTFAQVPTPTGTGPAFPLWGIGCARPVASDIVLVHGGCDPTSGTDPVDAAIYALNTTGPVFAWKKFDAGGGKGPGPRCFAAAAAVTDGYLMVHGGTRQLAGTLPNAAQPSTVLVSPPSPSGTQLPAASPDPRVPSSGPTSNPSLPSIPSPVGITPPPAGVGSGAPPAGVGSEPGGGNFGPPVRSGTPSGSAPPPTGSGSLPGPNGGAPPPFGGGSLTGGAPPTGSNDVPSGTGGASNGAPHVEAPPVSGGAPIGGAPPGSNGTPPVVGGGVGGSPTLGGTGPAGTGGVPTDPTLGGNGPVGAGGVPTDPTLGGNGPVGSNGLPSVGSGLGTGSVLGGLGPLGTGAPPSSGSGSIPSGSTPGGGQSTGGGVVPSNGLSTSTSQQPSTDVTTNIPQGGGNGWQTGPSDSQGTGANGMSGGWSDGGWNDGGSSSMSGSSSASWQMSSGGGSGSGSSSSSPSFDPWDIPASDLSLIARPARVLRPHRQLDSDPQGYISRWSDAPPAIPPNWPLDTVYPPFAAHIVASLSRGPAKRDMALVSRTSHDPISRRSGASNWPLTPVYPPFAAHLASSHSRGLTKRDIALVPATTTADGGVYAFNMFEGSWTEPQDLITNASIAANASAGSATTNPRAQGGGESNSGQVAGGVIGALVGLLVIAGGVWWVFFRKEKKTYAHIETGDRPSKSGEEMATVTDSAPLARNNTRGFRIRPSTSAVAPSPTGSFIDPNRSVVIPLLAPIAASGDGSIGSGPWDDANGLQHNDAFKKLGDLSTVPIAAATPGAAGLDKASLPLRSASIKRVAGAAAVVGAGVASSAGSEDSGMQDARYVVVYPHFPSLGDEIELRQGDIVSVRKIYKDGWCRGTNLTLDTTGVFPLFAVEETDLDSDPAIPFLDELTSPSSSSPSSAPPPLRISTLSAPPPTRTNTNTVPTTPIEPASSLLLGGADRGYGESGTAVELERRESKGKRPMTMWTRSSSEVEAPPSSSGDESLLHELRGPVVEAAIEAAREKAGAASSSYGASSSSAGASSSSSSAAFPADDEARPRQPRGQLL